MAESTVFLQPLYDKVLVRVLDAEEKVGSIIIPKSAQEKPVFGEIVAVGHGVPEKDGQLRALFVKPGQKVAFQKYAGQEVEIGSQMYTVLSEQEILGILQ